MIQINMIMVIKNSNALYHSILLVLIVCYTKLDVIVQYIIPVNPRYDFINMYVDFILMYEQNKPTKRQWDHEYSGSKRSIIYPINLDSIMCATEYHYNPIYINHIARISCNVYDCLLNSEFTGMNMYRHHHEYTVNTTSYSVQWGARTGTCFPSWYRMNIKHLVTI